MDIIEAGEIDFITTEITGKPVKPAIRCIDFVIWFFMGGFK